MKYPNAAIGVKRIFTAEILELIMALALMIATVLAFVALAAANANNATGATASGVVVLILTLGALILGIISFIMTIVGINNAKRDEPMFTKALIALMAGIVLQIVTYCIQGSTLAANLCSSLSYACDMLVTIYIAQGIGALADKLSNTELSAKCQSFIKLLTAVWLAAVCLKAISAFLSGNTTMLIIAGVLSIAATIASIVAYIIFLGLLNKGKKMLEAA